MKKRNSKAVSLFVLLGAGVALGLGYEINQPLVQLPHIEPVAVSGNTGIADAQKNSENTVYQYSVYRNDKFLKNHATLEEAVTDAKQWTNASVKNKDNVIVWDNFSSFRVYQRDQLLSFHQTYDSAVKEAKKWTNSSVQLKNNQIIWKTKAITASKLNVPRIIQLPELPRGSEVTSLAMILNFNGVEVSKMILAHEIKKDSTPYKETKEGVHFGNPNVGFVGDMYSFETPGYGVYHAPIKELADKYLPERVIDMTGSELNDVLQFVSFGQPVWVIHNVMFDEVPNENWQTWHTPNGDIEITMKEHSIVITGYDEKYIYINDPLGKANKIERNAFERGWNQMGKQAIAVLPK